MSFTHFYRTYRNLVRQNYPSAEPNLETTEIDRLVSPHRLELPKAVLVRAQNAIRALWSVSRLDSYQKAIDQEHAWALKAPSTPASVLMAYDFHTTIDGNAYLVEINTNAAGFLMSELAYQAHGLPARFESGSALQLLQNSFFAEANSLGLDVRQAVVVDEDFPSQKMFIEFLMYKDLMNKWGWRVDIGEAANLRIENGLHLSEAPEKLDFVYNRLTDFYLERPEFRALRQAYAEGLSCISPHPREYLLLGDKERLAEMALPQWLEKAGADQTACAAIREVLIPTYELSHFGSVDELWSQRKRLFFKPRRSHGGKSVYRGSSVSRKVFERICAEDFFAQEFVPAQAWPVTESDTHMENWKFDLRFFAFRDQIQLAICRCYQGQVTNFSSQFGGLTAVEFK